jgi:hypothetical protein
MRVAVVVMAASISSGACRAPRCRSPRRTERCHPPSAADQRSPCRLPIRGSRFARSRRFRRLPRTRAVLSHPPPRRDLGGRPGQVAPRPRSRRDRPSGPSDQPVPVRRARLAVRPGLADPLLPADPRGQAARQIREDLGGPPDLAGRQLPGGRLGRPVPEGIRSNLREAGWRTGQSGQQGSTRAWRTPCGARHSANRREGRSTCSGYRCGVADCDRVPRSALLSLVTRFRRSYHFAARAFYGRRNQGALANL